ncbi:MAG: hypothetical protein OXF56_27720 [Rhodobacteraceae bacterium]|nr:hypothetical protein [Paracoccaceae bacterium]
MPAVPVFINAALLMGPDFFGFRISIFCGTHVHVLFRRGWRHHTSGCPCLVRGLDHHQGGTDGDLIFRNEVGNRHGGFASFDELRVQVRDTAMPPASRHRIPVFRKCLE